MNLIEKNKAEEKIRLEHERFKSIFKAMPDGVYIVNQQYDIQYINPVIEQEFGQIQGRKCYEYFHDRHDICPWCKNKEVFSGKFVKWEWYSARSNKYYDLYDTPITNPDGTISKLEIFHDITDYKNAEKEKHEMQKQIVKSAKLASIGELAAGIAHEINNPLAIINGYINLLSETLKTPNINIQEIKVSLKEQEKAVSRISKIVDGLRVYARMDDNKYENFNINNSVINSIELIRNIYKKNSNITIETSLDSVELIAKGDEGKFQQISMNLLNNAKDAMKKSGGTILIETRSFDDSIVLSVLDEGPGIKIEDQDKIFDMFYTTKEVGEGTGMGLGLASSLVAEFKGTIEVDSKEGEGAKFVVTIPKSSTIDKEADTKSIKDKHKELTGHVLVVDDEKELRKILISMLESFGLTVDEAENGEIALEKINNTQFDIVITDIKMPKMSGSELIIQMAKMGGFEKNKSINYCGWY